MAARAADSPSRMRKFSATNLAAGKDFPIKSLI